MLLWILSSFGAGFDGELTLFVLGAWKHVFMCSMCFCVYFFVICLPRGVCGLVWDSPLMSGVLWMLSWGIDGCMALLTSSCSGRRSPRDADTLSASPLVCWSSLCNLMFSECVCVMCSKGMPDAQSLSSSLSHSLVTNELNLIDFWV